MQTQKLWTALKISYLYLEEHWGLSNEFKNKPHPLIQLDFMMALILLG